MRDLNKLAIRGNEVAFRNRSNYLKYKKLLSKHGWKGEMLKSSGPTIEGGYKRNAYYVIPRKVRRISRKRPTRRRKSSGNMMGGFSSFNWNNPLR